MRMLIVGLWLAASVAAVSAPCKAFDGHRKGFVIGFGAGPAVTSFTQTLQVTGYPDATSDRENKPALATEFRIGGGFNDRILLYYVNRVTWFSLDNVLGETVVIANSTGLLGASFYTQETSPSPYFTALLGVASWDTPFETESEALTGLGVGVGAGYEFSPHWSFELSLSFGAPSKEYWDGKISTSAVSLALGVHALAF
jgi:opacity protein-like surface antigen